MTFLLRLPQNGSRMSVEEIVSWNPCWSKTCTALNPVKMCLRTNTVCAYAYGHNLCPHCIWWDDSGESQFKFILHLASLFICGKIKLVFILLGLFIENQTIFLSLLMIILYPLFSPHQQSMGVRDRIQRETQKTGIGWKIDGKEREKGSDKVRQSEGEGSRQRDGCSGVAEVRGCCDD